MSWNRLKFGLVALGLGLCLCFSTAEAGFSKAKFKELSRQIAEALKNEEYPKIGELLKETAQDNTSKSVKLIGKILEKVKGDPEVLEPAKEGLKAQTNKGAIKAQQSLAKSCKDWHSRVMLLQLCAERGEKSDLKALVKAVNDKHPIVASNVIRVLCEKRHEAAVEPMLKLMEKLDRTKNPPWAELKYSLGELFGKNCMEGADFSSYWVYLQEQGGLKAVTEEARAEYRKKLAAQEKAEGGISSAVRLFGTEINCKRIVFILDISGSMKTIDPSDGDVKQPQGSTERGGEESKISERDARMRINRAKNELKRVIKALPSDVQFNIMAFSSGVKLFKPEKLYKLNAKIKSEATTWIDAIKAEGVTATDAALRSAFRVKGARCFYLLSDGKPSMGQGRDIAPSSIYELVNKVNELLKVRIFTLGFRGADTSFMRKLAQITGGTYADIR